MTHPYPAIINQLKSILEQECRVQTEYLKVLEEEASAMSPFRAEAIDRLNLQRAGLCERMGELHSARTALVSELSSGAETRLSDAIEKFCQPADKRLLFPLVRRLKTIVLQARASTREFGDLTSFSLSIVNSMISIIHSGGEGVTRAYTGRGILRESYHPGAARVASRLREA